MLCAARRWLRCDFPRSEIGNRGGDMAQFDAKVQAYNLQKFGAEYRSVCCELSQLPKVPLGKGSGAASHYVHRTGQAAVGAHVPDELTGSNRQSGVAAVNSFEVASYDDNSLGYPLALTSPGEQSTHRARLASFRNSRLSTELNATR